MPFIYTYLVDENGDYIVDEQGSRIILDSVEYSTTGNDWRRIASSTKRPPYIRSFQIRKFNDGDTWLLIVNQKQLIGIYPSQDASLQVLIGLFTRISANAEGAEATMTAQLSRGTSSIDSAENNLSLERSSNDLIITLSNIDVSAITTPVITVNDYTTPGAPSTGILQAVVTATSGTEAFTVVEGYFGVPENSYIQAYLEDFGVGIISSSNVLLKDDVAPTGFSVKIGTISDEDAAPEATTDGVTYTGAAYAYPQWVSNDWPEGVTPSYSYAWTYTIDAQAPVAVGGTGSTLNLALVPYGATLTCGVLATAYVNGKIATSTDPATQVAVAVTETSIEEVADIKLFLTADPNGVEQTTIQPTTEYFAYAYDTNGTLLTDTDITWEFPGQLTAPSNVAFTLSGTEVVGETITASTVTYDGGASTLVYSWNGAGPTTDQSTYLLDAGDEGNTVTLTVTASNNGGTSDGTATTGSIGPVPPPFLGGDYTAYMTEYAGVDYGIVPFDSASGTLPFTGGDGSTGWPYFDNSKGPAIGVGTTESGIVVTSPGPYNVRGITSQNFVYSNPYQYCAIGFREAGPGYLNTKAPGWVVLEVEAVPGTSAVGSQAYIPIEGTDGMVTDNGTSTYLPGQLPGWNFGGSGSGLDMIVFFFDDYQAGDVDTWTIWDGVTVP